MTVNYAVRTRDWPKHDDIQFRPGYRLSVDPQ